MSPMNVDLMRSCFVMEEAGDLGKEEGDEVEETMAN